jgi:hypothetical protein
MLNQQSSPSLPPHSPHRCQSGLHRWSFSLEAAYWAPSRPVLHLPPLPQCSPNPGVFIHDDQDLSGYYRAYARCAIELGHDKSLHMFLVSVLQYSETRKSVWSLLGLATTVLSVTQMAINDLYIQHNIPYYGCLTNKVRYIHLYVGFGSMLLAGPILSLSFLCFWCARWPS